MSPDINKKLANALKEKGLSISTAESCTGGLIAHYITSQSGSSAYFHGSVVSYTNQIKMEVLGVKKSSIDEHTEVSGDVAIQMAQGVRRLMHTDIGVSTTGIAGPTGALPNQPIGTVWIAVSYKDDNIVKCYHFLGNRAENIKNAAEAALYQVLNAISPNPSYFDDDNLSNPDNPNNDRIDEFGFKI